jgi:hypothetical protein
MAKFITGKELTDAIDSILFDAKERLLIVSPYIKLDKYFKDQILKKHLLNHDLKITVIFGKNEGKVGKSCSLDDFNYFKEFPNITIVYVPNLHAKYYGNENKGVITSINLYDYSFKHNIEYGVYTELNALDTLASELSLIKHADTSALQYSMDLARTHNVVFARRPVIKKSALGKLTGGLLGGAKQYLPSQTLFDATNELFNGRKYAEKRLSDFQDFVDTDNPEISSRVSRDEFESSQKSSSNVRERSSSNSYSKPTGYCIRKGIEIPFDPSRPMCLEAYRVWEQYGDIDFREQYCHKTGKPSFGKTSMRKPVLYS